MYEAAQKAAFSFENQHFTNTPHFHVIFDPLDPFETQPITPLKLQNIINTFATIFLLTFTA